MPAISVTRGTFAWSTEGAAGEAKSSKDGAGASDGKPAAASGPPQPTLVDVSLTVAPGTLLAVVGQVVYTVIAS